MKKRVNVEITNRRGDCLEQGGVCGRVESYPAKLVMAVMECAEVDLDDLTGESVVPYTQVTLADYMRYHYPSHVRVVRRGMKIQ